MQWSLWDTLPALRDDAHLSEYSTLERASKSHSDPAVGDFESAQQFREMYQACPASWTGTPPPPTMDFTYDNSVYSSFTPGVYNSALSQTLGELDFDNSIHKLFEGLPEIFEDHSYGGRDVDAAAHAVTVVSSPDFPSTPPAQGSRPNSMCGAGSVAHEGLNPAHEVSFTSRHPIRNAQQPVLILPKGGPESPLPPVTVMTDRKTGRKGRGPGARGKGGEFKMPAAAAVGAGKSKVWDATPIPANRAPSLVSAVAHMVPKILPADVKLNDQVAMAHPLHLGFVPQMCFRAPKRSRTGKDALPMGNSRTQRTRYFDKVEHIVRERWRRDDMASKFLALESLLPPSSKRDRSTIVEDSMKLVKSLQHRKEEALKKRAKLKQAMACATQSPGVKLSRIIQKIGSLAVMSPLVECNGPPSSRVGSSSKQPLLEEGDGDGDMKASIESSAQAVPKFLSDCVHRFYVHSELSTGDIVIEMICEQIPHFHSGLMASMESLGLDVLRCSVTQAVNKLICNITVKPLPSTASATSSSASIMEGLSAAFQKYE